MRGFTSTLPHHRQDFSSENGGVLRELQCNDPRLICSRVNCLLLFSFARLSCAADTVISLESELLFFFSGKLTHFGGFYFKFIIGRRLTVRT